ncbi:MAG: 30S ribosomal protein S6 [Saprospiraceae bacterium]
MRQFEVTFIVDPVLPKDEIQAKANKYVDYLKANDANIVHIDEMGLRQLAYPIKNRNSGIYYCIEFQSELGQVVDGLELTLRRDEELLRFLTVSLDKYGVKYNADKRAGLIGKKKKSDKKADAPVAAAAPKAEKPAEKPAPKAEAKPEPKPEPKAEPKAEAKSADDLKKIEGIGPKIAGLLNDAGILTFADLAGADVEKVKGILADAGSRYAMHDPTTWGQQAQLAADGKWDELKTLQDELQGGKPADSSEEE